MSFREVTWKKIILRLPPSKGQIMLNLLLGLKSPELWHSFAQGQTLSDCPEVPAPPLHLRPHTHVGPAWTSAPSTSSLQPQPDPTRNTFIKYISWCDARALTRYQTQIAIQGKFFWSFPFLQIMSLRFYLHMSSCWSNFPVEPCLFTPWWFFFFKFQVNWLPINWRYLEKQVRTLPKHL